METVVFEGWNCARVESGGFEALVTLDVGPRVIFLGEKGGRNLLHVKESTKGAKSLDGYNGFGGHRLWVAPEVLETTYAPDNGPVRVEDGFFVTGDLDPMGLSKSFSVSSEGEGVFEVRHRLTATKDTSDVSAWALTVMTTGGECWFPAPPFISHAEKVLPAGALMLWHYTNLADPRWSFEKEGIRLKQTENEQPQKIGAWVDQGWAAYVLGDTVFAKRFPSTPGHYPDGGVNFETFTRHDMLEVETLGVLAAMRAGETREHVERWKVGKLSSCTWDSLNEFVLF